MRYRPTKKELEKAFGKRRVATPEAGDGELLKKKMDLWVAPIESDKDASRGGRIHYAQGASALQPAWRDVSAEAKHSNSDAI
jgi:hypothetical protein